MKKLIILLLALMLISTEANAGWFDKEERQRRIEIEKQLAEQRHATEKWQAISAALGITCVILLVVGAAIGAKARREVSNGK